VEPNRAELIEIASLIQAGVLSPLIEAVFPLSQAREAFEHGAHGHNRGKIVLQVEEEPATEKDSIRHQQEEARRVA
jgi:NADPH:quinone reductase-like Zn-dependent oxidoreductase